MKKAKVVYGFTIVELLIVIIIIGILATISLVAYNGITSRAYETVLQSDLRNAASQLELAASYSGVYPADLASAGLKASTGTVFQYTPNSAASPQNYCVTATGNDMSYHIATDGKPTRGPCNGHTGTQIADLDCPAGYITVPGNSLFGTDAFCVMKYEAKNVGGVATSQADNAPWATISQATAISVASAACSGCQLISEAKWMTIAANVLSVSSNWSSGAVGTGYIYQGHINNNPGGALSASTDDNDGLNGITGGTGGAGSNNRRTLTLTNGEVIWDFSGNVYEWTTGTITSGQLPGLSGESAFGWKQWNNPSLLMNGLPANSRPSVISGTVAGYSSTQGIGQLNSNYGDTNTRGFIRGGNWYGSNFAGVLSLTLGNAPSGTGPTFGFRVSR